MKPSGIEWLGDVPAGWKMMRLKHISPFIAVGIVVNPSTFIVEEGLPFIYGGDIREGVIDSTNSRRISKESSQANAKTLLRTGDLLTVRVGAPGVTAVVPPEVRRWKLCFRDASPARFIQLGVAVLRDEYSGGPISG